MRLSMIIKRILIIGFGRMGMAYASAFFKSFERLELFIFDTNHQAARANFEKLGIEPKSVVWLPSIDRIFLNDLDFDLCVNCANVDGRWKYQRALNNLNIRWKIYEKPLLSRNYLEEIKVLQEESKKVSFVNFSRRLSPQLADLKQRYQSKIQKLVIRGKNLNLGSNWSHFVDLCAWLSDSSLTEIEFSIKSVAPSPQKDSRFSIIEGTCIGLFSGDAVLIVESEPSVPATKDYTSTITLHDGTEISYREIFDSSSFGEEGSNPVYIPLTSDVDFSSLFDLGSAARDSSSNRLPLVSEVIPTVFQGTKALYDALDLSGYCTVEVT